MPDSNLHLPLLLFLSHAGIDTEAARQLKQRLEAAPEAREHGLRVWFDKDDLRAGEPWQAQIEEAIATSRLPAHCCPEWAWDGRRPGMVQPARVSQNPADKTTPSFLARR